MSAHGNAAPVIIKRKKTAAPEAHHGGAWKVAYADFVTAMMAFFLLMWLLNATTEKQRKGLADYFSPSVPINRISGGGDGDFGGENVFSEDTLPKDGTGATSLRPTESDRARGETGVSRDEEALEKVRQALESALNGQGGESMAMRNLRRHVITRLTDEGLVIEIFDLRGRPLFEPGEAEPTATLRALSGMIGGVTKLVSNPAAVEAHTRARPVVLKVNAVWDLSTARAHRFRRLLEDGGLEPARVHRVTGHADRDPVVDDRMAIRNNRLEVVLLRSDGRGK